MKRLVGLMFCCVLVFEVLGQGKVEMSVSDFERRWEYLFEKFDLNLDNDNRMALCYGDSLRILASNSRDNLKRAKSHRLLGQVLRRIGNSSQARVEYKKGLEIAKDGGYYKEYGFILNGLGLIETADANYAEALKIHFDCLALREQNGECDEIASTLVNIGLVYLVLGHHTNACKYFQQVLDLPEAVRPRNLAMINYGVSLAYLKDFDRSASYLENGLNACGPTCSKQNLATISFGFGLLHQIKKNFVEAECFFERALIDAEAVDDRRIVVESLLQLSQIASSMRQIDKSIGYLKRCESRIRNTKLESQELMLYSEYCNVFLLANRPLDVQLYQEKYLNKRYAIDKGLQMNGLLDVHSQVTERQNQILIDYQREILSLKDDSLNKHISINVLLTIAAFLLLVIIGLLYTMMRTKEKEKRKLDAKVMSRTNILEENLRSVRVKDLINNSLLERATVELNASIASIHGLCGLVQVDPEIPRTVKPYFDELDRLAVKLKRIQRGLIQRDSNFI